MIFDSITYQFFREKKKEEKKKESEIKSIAIA